MKKCQFEALSHQNGAFPAKAQIYLKFQWADEAKKHIYIDRYQVTPIYVKEVIEMYINNNGIAKINI
jgi:hypothetical protein